jgi:hypothetical protein
MSDGYVVDFPTLGFLFSDWVTAHCVVPDGFERGDSFTHSDWQLWNVANHYRVKPTAKVGDLSTAFHNRRSQTVRPQKTGKGPFTASVVCGEAVGPALFAGWARGGEVWDCRDYGCGCGWVSIPAEPGDPLGMPWPTPLIQITAFSEEQTDNIYDALRPMIDYGPLSAVIPKTGEEFIRLPNGGRIDTVTSNAQSRLGQRVTFVPQDETGIWVQKNGMIKVAETQRRGLAGMGGRAWETTNAWNPAEDSVAQRTYESKVKDIFRDFPQAPTSLNYRTKSDRRKVHKIVYAGSPWVNLDAIEAEALELLEKDPAQAERFFGNRVVTGSGAAYDIEAFRGLAKADGLPSKRSPIVLGFDGGRFDDTTALVACDIASGHLWVVHVWSKPDEVGADDWEVPEAEVDAFVDMMFTDYCVWRMYADPPYWEAALARWAAKYGDKRVLAWATYRPRQMAEACRAFSTALIASEFTHDGSAWLVDAVGNACRRDLTLRDDKGHPLWVVQKERRHSPKKIDACVAAIIAWVARTDAVKAGQGRKHYAYTA